LHKSQTDGNKITHKSPDETDRARSRSLLQIRDSDWTPTGNPLVIHCIHHKQNLCVNMLIYAACIGLASVEVQ